VSDAGPARTWRYASARARSSSAVRAEVAVSSAAAALPRAGVGDQHTSNDSRHGFLRPGADTSTIPDLRRAEARGKFLFAEEKLYVRGVTYGTFAADERGNEFPNLEVVERDFAAMAAAGINAVRTYTVPPLSLLDSARDHGLRVMVGLAAERYVGYLNEHRRVPDLEGCLRAQVDACAGHPAVLCYAIGNEIPASVVRWFGRRRIEGWLRRLCRIVKEHDDAPVTYVNYPSTEYLQLPFLDLVAFNVYVEDVRALESYLGRLQSLAGERPLLLTELGLDSLRNGEATQAAVLSSEVRAGFDAGCAGVFVYAWTDEWCAGGMQVDNWAFGITDRRRLPKPALVSVRDAYSDVPFPAQQAWPRVSVIVCCYNSEATLRECLEGLRAVDYENFEVIVIDDGSTDGTAAIAREFREFRLVQTENQGLSAARNVGLSAATGEIVAYLDSDAWPDPHWLQYLAMTFEASTHGCVGGPNLAPSGDGHVAECVALAPGGPNLVLLSDDEAEHVPGCNMAFLASALRELGGFDPRFRVAGDDVDVCWRIRDRGWTIGISPAAVVWHHRRNSVRAYWKQQVGYGRAEALLEAKWPEKYNAAGHVSWGGRVYGGLQRRVGRTGRIYHGVWGSAPFQSFHERRRSVISSLALVPEWWLMVVTLTVLTALTANWKPMIMFVPALGAAVAPLVAFPIATAWSASVASRSVAARVRVRLLLGVLHVLQPLARLRGRLSLGLTPWRRGAATERAFPRGRTDTVWSTHWNVPERWVARLEADMRARASNVVRGGAYDTWDLEVRDGTLGCHRVLVAVEEHGGGQQLVRIRARPRVSRFGVALVTFFGSLGSAAAIDGAWPAASLLSCAALFIAVRMASEHAHAAGSVRTAVGDLRARAAEGIPE
jgi:O-antigen biosynthesis protein